MGMPGESAILYFPPPSPLFLPGYPLLLLPFFSERGRENTVFWAPEMEGEAFFAFILFFGLEIEGCLE